VIDSLNLSTGTGLLALRAADLRDQGCPAEEIERAVQASIPHVHTSFVVETMEYLYKGGRCTALQALMGSLLKIRPVIEIKQDGTMGVKEKLRGTRAKVLKSMLDDFETHIHHLDRARVFVTHCGCSEDALYVSEQIQDLVPEAEVIITEAGAVVSSHCGPGTIGILFLEN
jgi:DegV family protein with EDD domain